MDSDDFAILSFFIFIVSLTFGFILGGDYTKSDSFCETRYFAELDCKNKGGELVWIGSDRVCMSVISDWRSSSG